MDYREFRRKAVGNVVEIVYDNDATLYCRVLKLNRDGTFEYRSVIPRHDTPSDNPKGFIDRVKRCYILQRKKASS